MARPPNPLGREEGTEGGSGRSGPHAPDPQLARPGTGARRAFLNHRLPRLRPAARHSRGDCDWPLLVAAACGLALAVLGVGVGPAARGGEPPEASTYGVTTGQAVAPLVVQVTRPWSAGESGELAVM